MIYIIIHLLGHFAYVGKKTCPALFSRDYIALAGALLAITTNPLEHLYIRRIPLVFPSLVAF
jgi:hypothetical protein